MTAGTRARTISRIFYFALLACFTRCVDSNRNIECGLPNFVIWAGGTLEQFAEDYDLSYACLLNANWQHADPANPTIGTAVLIPPYCSLDQSTLSGTTCPSNPSTVQPTSPVTSVSASVRTTTSLSTQVSSEQGSWTQITPFPPPTTKTILQPGSSSLPTSSTVSMPTILSEPSSSGLSSSSSYASSFTHRTGTGQKPLATSVLPLRSSTARRSGSQVSLIHSTTKTLGHHTRSINPHATALTPGNTRHPHSQHSVTNSHDGISHTKPEHDTSAGIVVDGSFLPAPSSTITLTQIDGDTIVLEPSGVIKSHITIPFPTIHGRPSIVTSSGVTLTFENTVRRSQAVGTSQSTGVSPSFGKTTGTTISAQVSLITPPPQATSSSSTDALSLLGILKGQAAITIQGDKYVLPPSPLSLPVIQSNGDSLTLFAGSIVSGSLTLKIPAPTSQSRFTLGSIPVEAGPVNDKHSHHGGHKGGHGFWSALFHLGDSAGSIVQGLGSFEHAVQGWASGAISDSSFFSSSIADSLANGASQLSTFVESLSSTIAGYDIELQDLSKSQQSIVADAYAAAVDVNDVLQSLTRLRTLWQNPIPSNILPLTRAYWRQAAVFGSFTGGLVILKHFSEEAWLAQEKSSPTTKSQTATVSSTSSTTSNDATPSPWLLTTKDGTPISAFKAFIKTLPDEGNGIQIVFDYVPWQRYVTNLTREKADDVAKQPIISLVTVCTGLVQATDETAAGLNKRAPPDTLDPNLRVRENGGDHLRIISVENQRSLPAGAPLPDYTFDPLLGQGQTVYVLEGGFDMDNVDLRPLSHGTERKVRRYVVQNELSLINIGGNIRATQDMTDYTGHGTHVASTIGGVNFGVASKANLALVKFRNAVWMNDKWHVAQTTAPGISQALDWILYDVEARRRAGDHGKSIVNLSGGESSRANPNLRSNDEMLGFHIPTGETPGDRNIAGVMERVLQRFQEEDIIFVVAAGNSGGYDTLDQFTPTVLGTKENALITVGSVNVDGILSDFTTPENNAGGSISLYALGVKVEGANWRSKTNNPPRILTGTSHATAAVSGLIAYFASLPSLADQWRPGSVSKDFKDYVVKYAYQRNDHPLPPDLDTVYKVVPAEDSIIVAYNRAGDGLCSSNAAPDRRFAHIAKRMLVGKRQGTLISDVPIVSSGRLIAPGLISEYCRLTTTSSSQGHATSSTSRTSSSSDNTLNCGFTNAISGPQTYSLRGPCLTRPDNTLVPLSTISLTSLPSASSEPTPSFVLSPLPSPLTGPGLPETPLPSNSPFLLTTTSFPGTPFTIPRMTETTPTDPIHVPTGLPLEETSIT